MSAPDEKKKISLNVAAVIAIALWVISIVFQAGGIYAYAAIRDYVDKKDAEISASVEKKFDKILEKIEKLQEQKIDKEAKK